MITIKDVSFSYEGENTIVPSLEDINLTIEDGACIVLCGGSGSGKTSMTRLINGLIPSYYSGQLSGKVCINGRAIDSMELYEIAGEVGSVFQNPKSQFFNADVPSELSFVCENLGLDKDTIQKQVQASVSAFAIEKLLPKNVDELSGGEKQKVACACVATPNPDVFVFDEPSANLDYAGIQLLRDVLTKLKGQKKTIVIAEHRLYYLSDIVDQYVYMEQGKITHTFSKKEFCDMPFDLRLALGLRSPHEVQVSLEEIPQSTPSSVPLIDFKDFTYRFHKKDKPTLDIPQLAIPTGAITAIMGLNGAGKSTFANCICGIYKKCGTISIDGELIPTRKRLNTCYMVMQDCNHQLFTETVVDEVLLSMPQEDEAKALQILGSLNLLELKDRHPMSLSGGQKQRLAIATALASNRKLIVFDEPTSGLDYKNMLAVSDLLKNLRNLTSCILVITHDTELVEQCADYVLQLHEGTVQGLLKKS